MVRLDAVGLLARLEPLEGSTQLLLLGGEGSPSTSPLPPEVPLS